MNWSIPNAFIQWKGTDACIDLYCSCGNQEHLDKDFLYEWKCHKCKRLYKLDATIRLIEIDVCTGKENG